MKKGYTTQIFLLVFVLWLRPDMLWAGKDFTFTDIKGNKYQLSDYQGKWLVLNYWATWCPPCREEIPMLIEYGNTRDDVMILGINFEPGIDQQRLNDFIDTYLIDYPIIPITKAIARRFGNPQALPMTVFISPKGRIVRKYTGQLNKALLDRIMKK